MRRLLLASMIALAACSRPVERGVDDEAALEAAVESQRAVVEAAAPLNLSNTRRSAVTHPLWGGAFTLGPRAVVVRLTLEARGSAGVLFGRRVDPDEAEADDSGAVELARSAGGAWVLRELAGTRPVREIEVPSGATELAIGTRDVRVVAGAAERKLALSRPLAAEVGTYVRLAPGAELVVRELSIAQEPRAASRLGPPLRDLADARGVGIGTATDVWPPLSDARFEALLGEQFGLVAPTDFYWSTTRGEDRDFDFLPADVIVNYARVHRQRVHGYFLVWDFALPKWLEGRSASELGAILDEHVTTTVSRYRGRVGAWAVVNEAVWGPERSQTGASALAENVWSDALGASYIERAFRGARAADPDALLFYNETGAESLGSKSDFVHAMLRDLVARGVPVGGVGFQFHLDASALPALEDVKANLERFAALGLEVHITELDVSLAHVSGTLAEKEALQARVYADVMRTCRAVPGCRSTTVFGFGDRYAWDELGDATPLLFDATYRAKPAFFALQRALGADR